MNLARTLNQLGGYVQDEVSARRRTLRLLEEQEQGVRNNDPRATAEAVRKLEREMSTNTDRARRRARLLDELAREWSVSADLLTLGSIVERGGAAAAHIAPLRDELRSITAAVIHKNRLLGSLIGMHRRVIRDVIECVLEDEKGAVLNGAGTLIDAEA
ncbi:MAG: hypothetical protein H6831_11755 [Planctomycetes bacterium]|nr:hypothetical protein [Planctomycetota bacterium]MCB9905075.1 hypothetical protein [Planctomycetota bacterium]